MSKLTPPATRSALGLKQTNVCTRGELVLQHCRDCTKVQYPHREICGTCLSSDLFWQSTVRGGVVSASSLLHHSLDPFFKEHGPWLMGSVKLDCGPVVLAHLEDNCEKPGTRVQVINQIDASGQSVLVAMLDSIV